MMRTISLSELAAVVKQLGAADLIADRFGCSLQSASKMIEAAKVYRPADFPERVPAEPEPASEISDTTLDLNDLEWSWQREKRMLRKGSDALLLAQLRAGQHRLPPEVAQSRLARLQRCAISGASF